MSAQVVPGNTEGRLTLTMQCWSQCPCLLLAGQLSSVLGSGLELFGGWGQGCLVAYSRVGLGQGWRFVHWLVLDALLLLFYLMFFIL